MNYKYSARSFLALIFQYSIIVSEEEVVFRSSFETYSDSMVTQYAGCASIKMVKGLEDFRRFELRAEKAGVPPLVFLYFHW